MDGGGGRQELLQGPGCSELHSVLLPAVLWLLIAAMHLEALGLPVSFNNANVTGFGDTPTLGCCLCSGPVPWVPLCSCVGKC